MLHDRLMLTAASSSAVTPGSQTFIATGPFVVPAFNTLIVELVGPGGGGGAFDTVGVNGANGLSCTFAAAPGTLTAGGGRGGSGATGTALGGTASGGDTNTSGSIGSSSTSNAAGGNAAGPFGGAGGVAGAVGNPPGGGGGGTNSGGGGGGGGGSYCKKTYSAGDLTVGASITVTVPAGASGGNDAGTIGAPGGRAEVRISWS